MSERESDRSNSDSPVASLVARLLARRVPATLLAVCPNSAAVTQAAVRAAHRLDAPMMFAATLNQVDLDGGYTGWTPDTLTEFLRVEVDQLGTEVPVYVGLDHCGPWTKDLHYSEQWSYADTMAAARATLEACIDSGYGLLHIDATVDPGRPGEVGLEELVARTVELITDAERYRLMHQYPAVAYEVGTEEVHGGMADRSRFIAFVDRLYEALSAAGLESAWPAFFVGRVGTDLHTTRFDATEARALAEIVRPFGSTIKGHYTDFVDNPADYPAAGMGGANVGPEFADVEVQALLRLAAIERKLGCDSRFRQALKTAVVDSNRWRKWLSADEQAAGATFEDLAPPRQDWLMRTGSRYVWRSSVVQEARHTLYENVSGELDPDSYVVAAIEDRIAYYLKAFNLVGQASWASPATAI